MSTASVTICIPTIGRMEYLPKTEASFRGQTRKDVDVIILDNESGADARALIDAWKARDANVRVIRSEPRIPMLENFNLGIRAATTDLVTFWHDDDEFNPDYIEKMAALLSQHPNAGLVGSNCDLIDENSVVTERRRWVPHDMVLSRREYVSSLIARGRNLIPMAGVMYRRSTLGNGFDTSLPIYYGDFIMLMSFAEKADIAILADPVVRVRRHSIQASHMVLSRAIPIRTGLLRTYLDGYVKRFPEDRAMVRRLRRRVALTHRVSLLWGWASAASDEERRACLDSLDKTTLDAALTVSLRGVGALGVKPEKAAGRAFTLARRVAGAIGL